MKNTRNLFGIIALVAVIALAMTGCSSGADPCSHSYGSWAPKAAATCMAKATEERACALCGEKQTQSVGIPDPDAHDEGWVMTPGYELEGCLRSGCGYLTGDYYLTLAIGDTGPGGGIIFYVADGGGTPARNPISVQAGPAGEWSAYTAYYLEVWTTDEIASDWGSNGAVIAGVTTFTNETVPDALLLGNGRKDTWLIVTYLGESVSNRAAQRCVNATHGGKNDWFLPSLGELKELKGKANMPSTGYYWSSSQYDEDYAWFQGMAGSAGAGYGNGDYYVRAIRAF